MVYNILSGKLYIYEEIYEDRISIFLYTFVSCYWFKYLDIRMTGQLQFYCIFASNWHLEFKVIQTKSTIPWEKDIPYLALPTPLLLKHYKATAVFILCTKNLYVYGNPLGKNVAGEVKISRFHTKYQFLVLALKYTMTQIL